MKNILSYEEIEMVCQAAAKAGIRKFENYRRRTAGKTRVSGIDWKD